MRPGLGAHAELKASKKLLAEINQKSADLQKQLEDARAQYKIADIDSIGPIGVIRRIAD